MQQVAMGNKTRVENLLHAGACLCVCAVRVCVVCAWCVLVRGCHVCVMFVVGVVSVLPCAVDVCYLYPRQTCKAWISTRQTARHKTTRCFTGERAIVWALSITVLFVFGGARPYASTCHSAPSLLVSSIAVSTITTNYSNTFYFDKCFFAFRRCFGLVCFVLFR